MTRLAEFVKGRTMPELYDLYWVPTVLDVYAKGLADYVKPGESVLDLACGTGIVAGYAAVQAGPEGEVVGVDPTLDLLDAARNKTFSGAPVQWVEGFGEDLPFDDSSFDVVLCHQGLQYVSDRETVLAEVKRVLRPGGTFHAGVWASAEHQPAFGFAEDSLARHIGPEQKPVHAWSFGGLSELKRVAERAGLEVQRLETLERNARFESIQRFVDTQIACAGRTDENGQLAMGLVDLNDERWLPAIAAFLEEARAALASFVQDGALVAPFASDEMSARS